MKMLKLNRDYIQAEISALTALIASLPERDYLGRLSLETRQQDLVEELDKLAAASADNVENRVDQGTFNRDAALPYALRLDDFRMAMQDVYDFFDDVNGRLLGRGLRRLEETLRPAAMSGIISDFLTASLSSHARSLTENTHFNGHPDLVVSGVYPTNSVQAGTEGVEIKSTRMKGGAVDTHGARAQWMCVFVYKVDTKTEPARNRRPMSFTAVYLAPVNVADFRKNARYGELGTRTATLHKEGLKKLREYWLYRTGPETPAAASVGGAPAAE